MTKKKTAPAAEKPYLRGMPTDENTVRQALKFFGALILVGFMSFIVCSMTSFDSAFFRILVNVAIEGLILLIFFSKGADLGTDGVARGEILYQHIQKGQDAAPGEKRIPFHPLKGIVIGCCGTILFFIPAMILAFTAERQMTGTGMLPSWTDSYMRRTEISGALAAYTQGASITITDILRIVIRMMLMPFISMAGSENRDLLLTIERISPLLVLIPALTYGIGYLQGPARRKIVHSEIAANNKKRISREKRQKKAKNSTAHIGPEQLN